MYETEIAAAATKYNVSVALVTAVVQHESSFNPLQIGDNGEALGLMQVHEGAAEDMGDSWTALDEAIANDDVPSAIATGLDIGVAYLGKMLKTFNGNTTLALMAYNQGPTVIKRADEYAAAVLNLMGKQT